jgi:Protein of unknown function (DUF664)
VPAAQAGIVGVVRSEPALQGSEADLMRGFLDYQRATFVHKIAGLDRVQFGQRIATSQLTLAGLTKHLALVEDSWFQDRFLGLDAPEPWASAPFDDDPDWEFHSALDDEPDYLVGLYEAACDRSRRAVDGAPRLDQLSAQADRKTGERLNLRWIMLHLIEETARHNGHADLLREAIDGAVGE